MYICNVYLYFIQLRNVYWVAIYIVYLKGVSIYTKLNMCMDYPFEIRYQSMCVCINQLVKCPQIGQQLAMHVFMFTCTYYSLKVNDLSVWGKGVTCVENSQSSLQIKIILSSVCVCTNLINLYVYNYPYSQPALDIYKTTFYLTINVRVVLLYMNTLMCIYISSDLKWIWNLLVYFQNRKWTPGNYDRQKSD